MALSTSILIVDDDIELGALLAEAVGDMSDAYAVKVAKNADEAMVFVRRAQTAGQSFDLLVTDIKMSGLSGLELLEALQTIAPGTKAIAMTAFAAPELGDRSEELGVYAYLTKPFALSEFRDAVRQTLQAPPRALREDPARDDGLSTRQRAAVTRALGALRAATGADAALVVRRDGVVIAVDVLGPPRPIADLGAEIESALRTIADQMTRAFDQDVPVRQSYFGTAIHSVCTYRIDDSYTAAVIFGPAVRQGQIWYYLREAAHALEGALDGKAPPLPAADEGPEDDVFDLMRRFFPEVAPRSGQRRAAGAAAMPPVGADGPGATPPTDHAGDDAPELEVPATQGDAQLADLDWDVGDALDWTALAGNTDAGAESTPHGLTFDQAREQGLIGDIDGE